MNARAGAMRVALLVLAIGLQSAGGGAFAQTPQQKPPAAPAPAKAAPPAIDPNVIAALEEMGAFLRGQTTLALKRAAAPGTGLSTRAPKSATWSSPPRASQRPVGGRASRRP